MIQNLIGYRFWIVVFGSLFVLCGCGKSSNEVSVSAKPLAPKEAASRLQQAFSGADVAVKKSANSSSEALKTGNYEVAIQSIQQIKSRTNLTVEQGIAVYNAEVSLESKLIDGVNRGDPNALRAYEVLKKSRRN